MQRHWRVQPTQVSQLQGRCDLPAPSLPSSLGCVMSRNDCLWEAYQIEGSIFLVSKGIAGECSEAYCAVSIGREDALRVCTVIESEVILANVLSGDDSDRAVTWKELAEYCNAVRRHLEKTVHSAAQNVYFDLSQHSIKRAVRSYDHLFGVMGDQIFAHSDIDASYFNSRLRNEVRRCVVAAAEELRKSRNDRRS